ncbi:hypothetical protein [Roseimicrobium sp. ORNL1]|uniref:hypothetical protein n=1 Tax=Roseimicrobium sp. ORNL1 TaxID=2711231 RepID=UPI0013E14B8D|nr:hypothetical protein [Roseimicrobium sp. ORNL1]QIF04638.1 hypothetical protein G5S37_24950 [Roseimicrobium sp. ORNL1]
MFTKPFPGGRGLELKKQRGAASSLPHHPFELYRTRVDDVTGWAVYPASVNGIIEPEIDGISIFSIPAPFLTVEENFTAYLNFNLDGTKRLGNDGKWYLVPGKQQLSNVVISLLPGEEVGVAVDPDSGILTQGHYVYPIGEVAAGEVVEQTRRFSVYFTVCNSGQLVMAEYG